MPEEENPYLRGNFAPVAAEATTTRLEVIGDIPQQLEGRLLRIGPNPLDHPGPDHHWFVGTGLAHGVRLRGGRAEWYHSRLIRSPDVSARLGEDPVPDPWPPDHGVFSANTNIVSHAGRTWALVEAGSPPLELDYALDTVAVSDFEGTLPRAYSAHPKRDPATGELHAIAYWWGWGNKVQYLVLDVEGRISRTVDVEVSGGPMIHDTSITEKHIAVMDLPCVFDIDMATAGRTLPYRWDPDYPARIGWLDRAGSEPLTHWFEIEPCYIFHPLNSYELSDGRIVLDAVRHPKMFDTFLVGPDEGPPRLVRWTFDLDGDRVTEDILDDRPQEFPRLRESLVGRPYRFGYSVASAAHLEPGSLLKHDLVSGTTVEHVGSPGRHHMEAVFVARDETDDSPDREDDGWLMAYTYEAESDSSSIVIVDARDMTSPPVAEIRLGTRVPYGFHGNWCPD